MNETSSRLLALIAENLSLAEKATGRGLYVIVKRGLYYRENAGGYTACISEAWKLPLEQAKKYEMYADNPKVPQCEKVLIEPCPVVDIAYPAALKALEEAQKGFDTLRSILKKASAGEPGTWGLVAMFMEMIDEAEKETAEKCLALMEGKP